MAILSTINEIMATPNQIKASVHSWKINLPVLNSIEPEHTELINDSSTISISDLKDMQSATANIPKKSRRRRGSDKNTISLDI